MSEKTIPQSTFLEALPLISFSELVEMGRRDPAGRSFCLHLEAFPPKTSLLKMTHLDHIPPAVRRIHLAAEGVELRIHLG